MVQERVPAVLDDLRRTVLPLHQGVFDLAIPDEPFEDYTNREQRRIRLYSWEDRHLFDPSAIPEYFLPNDPRPRPQVALRLSEEAGEAGQQALREGLHAWARRWHLTDDWFLGAALHQLGYWRFADTADYNHWEVVEPISWQSLPLDERRFVFEDAGWDAPAEPRDVAEKRIRQAFDRALRRYFRDMDREMQGTGWTRTLYKPTADHFTWLVAYQVEGLSYPRIAQQFYRDRVTVMEGVKRVASLIGLTLRPPSKPGRPRKTAT
jgi:hypothetical protein